jgi:hypothetical protein
MRTRKNGYKKQGGQSMDTLLSGAPQIVIDVLNLDVHTNDLKNDSIFIKLNEGLRYLDGIDEKYKCKLKIEFIRGLFIILLYKCRTEKVSKTLLFEDRCLNLYNSLISIINRDLDCFETSDIVYFSFFSEVLMNVEGRATINLVNNERLAGEVSEIKRMINENETEFKERHRGVFNRLDNLFESLRRGIFLINLHRSRNLSVRFKDWYYWTIDEGYKYPDTMPESLIGVLRRVRDIQAYLTANP